MVDPRVQVHGRNQAGHDQGSGELKRFSYGLQSALILMRTFSYVTYREILPGWVLPVINLSQASAHSRTISVAYLLPQLAVDNHDLYLYLLLILAFSGECKLILWLAIWDFIDTEPFI